MATPVPAPEELAFTATTTWGDACYTFTSSQQDCIMDALGQPQMNSLLRKTMGVNLSVFTV